MTVRSTGVGSMPGEDIRETVRLVLGEVSLPFLPELPARPYGDMLSRAVAVLPELAVDLQPAGWRLTGGTRPGLDQRRARSLLLQDLDALEELAGGHSGAFKVQLTGPWTLAATLERPRGDKVLADHGARRDLADALALGLSEHLDEVRRRLPQADLVVQLDEPGLPAVLAGAIPTASGWGKHRSVDQPGAIDLLRRPLEAAGGAATVLHCCAKQPPVALFRKAGAGAISVDLSLVDHPTWDDIATVVEGGGTLYAGVVPTRGALQSPDQVAPVLTRRWLDLGLPAKQLADVVVTPTCGLAGATPSGARATLALTRRTADHLTETAES
ncbi:MAG TPA: methionine synthase vitamin-B12 independent [Kribbellaceae bacterium]|nr:methionine synthase vitamin-B12 independent [Kribbellaceae bacterium]